jgi:hypothetical protein
MIVEVLWRLKEVGAVILGVPAPLNENREPDISCTIDAGTTPQQQKYGS